MEEEASRTMEPEEEEGAKEEVMRLEEREIEPEELEMTMEPAEAEREEV